MADLRAQLTGLLHRGFVATLGHRRLRDAVRYLAAMAVRLEKLPATAGRDAIWQAQVEAVTEEHRELRTRVPVGRRPGRPGGPHPVDGGGAAGVAVRALGRHPPVDQRAAHPQGDRRPGLSRDCLWPSDFGDGTRDRPSTKGPDTR